jgi:hypothetical protein
MSSLLERVVLRIALSICLCPNEAYFSKEARAKVVGSFIEVDK